MNKTKLACVIVVPVLILGVVVPCGLLRLTGRRETTRSIDTRSTALARKSVGLVHEADLLREERRDLPQAIGLYREALRQSDSYRGRVGLAEALADDGLIAQSREALQRLLGLMRSGHIQYYSNDLAYVLELGDSCARVGLTNDACAIYATLTNATSHQVDARFSNPALDHNPAYGRVNAMYAVALSKLRVHRNAEAVALFQRIVADRPDWAGGRFMLAYANDYAGNRVEAEKNYTRAAKMGFRRPKVF